MPLAMSATTTVAAPEVHTCPSAQGGRAIWQAWRLCKRATRGKKTTATAMAAATDRRSRMNSTTSTAVVRVRVQQREGTTATVDRPPPPTAATTTTTVTMARRSCGRNRPRLSTARSNRRRQSVVETDARALPCRCSHPPAWCTSRQSSRQGPSCFVRGRPARAPLAVSRGLSSRGAAARRQDRRRQTTDRGMKRTTRFVFRVGVRACVRACVFLLRQRPPNQPCVLTALASGVVTTTSKRMRIDCLSLTGIRINVYRDKHLM